MLRESPRGLADAFIIGRDFVGSDRVALVLGDNIFYGHGLSGALANAVAREEGATVFAYVVASPEQYGVVELDSSGRAISIEEETKPAEIELRGHRPLFLRQSRAGHRRRAEAIAARQIEITDVNRAYMEDSRLFVEILGAVSPGSTPVPTRSLTDASQFVQILEQRQGLRVSCPEEIALRLGYITLDQFHKLATLASKSRYGLYLLAVHRAFADRSGKTCYTLSQLGIMIRYIFRHLGMATLAFLLLISA